jgi:L-gulono-1,4-lactone dehydrogenase
VSPLWRNWTGDQRCAPHVIERPETEAELCAAVARAAEVGRRLRVSGSGHSFTDIACTDDHMVRLDRMNRVLEADTDSGLVRVQAGITLHDLGRELAERGLAMENQGDIDAQQLGGAIATATHGTGVRFPNLSAQVAALRLVTADGEAREVSPESDSEAFLAARVGLGTVGVVSEVVLRCVPLFTIHRVDRPASLGETLARIEELTDSNDHFEFYAFPYSDLAVTRESERTDREPVPVSRSRVFLQEVILENRAFDLIGRVGRRFPGLIPRINRRLAGLVNVEERTDRSHVMYASRRDVRFTEMEYAIPRAAGAEAVRRVFDLVERRRLPVGFPIEVRFVAADDALLSPAHERETCYVAVHMFEGMDFESYFRGVEQIMDEYGGRPHWGKRHYQTAATLEPRYPGWNRFRAFRARLDPAGLFSNAYVDRVLGQVGAPVAT